jgi:hypothetical protein
MGSLSPRQSAKSKLALLHMSYSILYCTLFLNYCSCFVALRDFEMEADEEAKRAAKAAERDRKRAEKEAEEEAQRAAKAAQHDAKWTADVDPTIERMIGGCSYYSDIALELGSGLKKHDIGNRWTGHLKELSGIIKPAVQAGRRSSITWTAEDDATIVRMRTDGFTFAKIASELGNGLTNSDIKNRRTRHLKDKLQ